MTLYSLTCFLEILRSSNFPTGCPDGYYPLFLLLYVSGSLTSRHLISLWEHGVMTSSRFFVFFCFMVHMKFSFLVSRVWFHWLNFTIDSFICLADGLKLDNIVALASFCCLLTFKSLLSLNYLFVTTAELQAYNEGAPRGYHNSISISNILRLQWIDVIVSQVCWWYP